MSNYVCRLLHDADDGWDEGGCAFYVCGDYVGALLNYDGNDVMSMMVVSVMMIDTMMMLLVIISAPS